MDQNVTKPSVIRPVRTRSILRNRLVQYLILIPACWALPFLINPYINTLSNFVGIILLIPWGLSCIFFVNLLSTFTEYRKAVQLDQEGTQILVPVKAKYDEETRYKGPNMDDVSVFFGLYKYKIYILEYELPGSIFCWSNVSEKMYLRSEVGKTLAVRFMSDNPEIQRIESVADDVTRMNSSGSLMPPTVTPIEKLSSISKTNGKTGPIVSNEDSRDQDNKPANLQARDFLRYFVFMLPGWSLGYLTGFFSFSNVLLKLWGTPEPLNDITFHVVGFMMCSLPLMAVFMIPITRLGRKIFKQNAKRLTIFILFVSFICGFAIYLPIILFVLTASAM